MIVKKLRPARQLRILKRFESLAGRKFFAFLKAYNGLSVFVVKRPLKFVCDDGFIEISAVNVFLNHIFGSFGCERGRSKLCDQRDTAFLFQE